MTVAVLGHQVAIYSSKSTHSEAFAYGNAGVGGNPPDGRTWRPSTESTNGDVAMVRNAIERSSFDVLGHARRASLNYKVVQVLWLRDQGLAKHDVNDIWIIELKSRNVEHKICEARVEVYKISIRERI